MPAKKEVTADFKSMVHTEIPRAKHTRAFASEGASEGLAQFGYSDEVAIVNGND